MSVKKLVPFFLAGIGAGLCLLVIATAALVACDRATTPASQDTVEVSVAPEKDAQGEQGDNDEKDAQVEQDSGGGTEDAPAENEATPSVTHKTPTEPAPEVEPEPVPSTESSFVRTAREGLGVPDDPAITYQIGEPYYWEGAGITVTPITFYQGDVIVARADCTEDGSPATTILGYPGMLA